MEMVVTYLMPLRKALSPHSPLTSIHKHVYLQLVTCATNADVQLLMRKGKNGRHILWQGAHCLGGQFGGGRHNMLIGLHHQCHLRCCNHLGLLKLDERSRRGPHCAHTC